MTAFDKIQSFWNSFWLKYSKNNKNIDERDIQAHDKLLEQPIYCDSQKYTDISQFNPCSIIIHKLDNLVNTDATFDLISDSKFAEQLDSLLQNLEDKRSGITTIFLSTGDCWVFPSTDADGNLYHRFLPQSDVRILATNGENVTDVIGIVDKILTSNGKMYYLCRRHTLTGSTLVVEVYVTDTTYERVSFPQWQWRESIYRFDNADNLGVGRFKSKTSSRGLSPFYGVPLNFGLSSIEDKIFNDFKLLEDEYKYSPSIIFADPLILQKDNCNAKKGFFKNFPLFSQGWKFAEKIFPVDTRGGSAGANVDYSVPTIRFNEYISKLDYDLHQYEMAIGVDNGFLTKQETGMATATEIRRANATTISMIDSIQTVIKEGVTSTINADCLFLNIDKDSFSIKFDFYDVFDEPDKQYERIVTAVRDGFAEPTDAMKYLFPEMSINDLEEKYFRILESKKTVTEEVVNEE